MRYCLDTEFYERPGRIEWISVALVREDGAEFYAENDSFDWHSLRILANIEGPEGDTPRWLLENVWPHLRGGDYEMSALEAREAIEEFTQDIDWVVHGKQPKFWAWYGDYDWVVFCWLFGRMIDLPKEYPMYCRDFRQVCEQFGIKGKDLAPDTGQAHDALADAHRLNDMIREFERTGLRAEGVVVDPLA